MTEVSLSEVLNQLRRVAAPAQPPDAELVAAFVSERSEAAFQHLAERHGPMVFGVCRRVLKHIQDAEDAFQAVFIVLARKAGVIRPPEAVGRWLYGTAVRTARKAKYLRDRRVLRQTTIDSQRADTNEHVAEPNDWLPVLDEELTVLSERHRLPIILCDVLGRSRQEAAVELGIAEGTLSSRLARGHEYLRSRLVRRGVLPAVGTISLDSAANANAEVPPSLLEPVVNACCGSATSSISHSAASLAEGVIRSMFMSKLQKALVVACIVAALGLAGWSVGSRLMAEPKLPAVNETQPTASQDAKKAPDDKPKAEAKKDDRLAALRTARLKALTKQVEGLNARIEARKEPLIEVLDANKKLMEAELALCNTNEQRLAVYVIAFKRFKVIEERSQSELEAGVRTANDVEQAKAARLEIEILWEQAKAK